MLYEKTNYTADISYLNNVFIYEYDMSKSNINILFSKGFISQELYDYLYSAPRMVRQTYIGKMERENPAVTEAKKAGVIEAKKMLFEANGIQDHEVISIKNDAVFVIRKLNQTKFGLYEFKCKNIYTSFFKIYNYELYYYFNVFDKSEVLDVKGINDEKLKLHESGMMVLIKDVLRTLQVSGIDITIPLMKRYYMQYISYQLPISFYRTFDVMSLYVMKYNTLISSAFTSSGSIIDECNDQNKYMIDITYNALFLMQLQKILINIYFVKHSNSSKN